MRVLIQLTSALAGGLIMMCIAIFDIKRMLRKMREDK